MQRIAVVHVDDSFGEDCLAGAMKGFKQAGGQPVTVIKADRSKPDYASIVPALLKVDAQSVIWIGSSVAVSGGVKALRKAGSQMQVVTVSNNASSGFVKQLGQDFHGVVVSQVFPNVRSMSYALNREAAALAKAKGGVALSPSVMEGFAAAKVLVEGLKRAGRSPSRASLIAGLESLQDFDLGGLQVSYGPKNHSGLTFVDASIVNRKGMFTQ